MDFQKLPRDLQCLVAEQCDRGTLALLSVASKTYHDLLTPVLYRMIDLSSHSGTIRGTQPYNPEVPMECPADWPRSGGDPVDGEVYRRQLVLIRTLRDQPSLGEHVRVLRWTIVDRPAYEARLEYMPLLERYRQREMSRREVLASVKEYLFYTCNSCLWDAFATFTHVLEVDLAFLHIEDREADPPPPLFRQARSLQLSGIASSFVVKSILSSIDPASLRHLHFNGLGLFADLQGVQEDLPRREKGKLRPFPPVVPGTGGPVGTLLQEYIGRWPNLQSLFIDTLGPMGVPGRTEPWHTRLNASRPTRSATRSWVPSSGPSRGTSGFSGSSRDLPE